MFEFSSAQTFMGHRFLRDEFYFFEPKWVHTGILLNYYTKAKTYIKSCVKYAIISAENSDRSSLLLQLVQIRCAQMVLKFP